MMETNMLPDFDLSQLSLHNLSLHNSSVIKSVTTRSLVQVIAPRNGTEPTYVSNPLKELRNLYTEFLKLFVLSHNCVLFGLVLPGFLQSNSGLLTNNLFLFLPKLIYQYSICLLICTPLPKNYLNILYKSHLNIGLPILQSRSACFLQIRDSFLITIAMLMSITQHNYICMPYVISLQLETISQIKANKPETASPLLYHII